MKHFLLAWMICVICGTAFEIQPNPYRFDHFKGKEISISFTGTVKSIEPLGQRELRVFPVDVASRFAITIHIEAVTPRESPLKSGEDQVFAVHSPAKLFKAAAKDVVGRKYRFKVKWDETRFSDLTAVPIEDKQPASPERLTR